MASGLCTSAWISFLLRKYYEWTWKKGFYFHFAIYAVLGIVKCGLTFLLSERCEANYAAPSTATSDPEMTTSLLNNNRRMSYTKAPKTTSRVRRMSSAMVAKVNPESRTILIKICFLFGLNSFAQGMLPVTLMSWYANWRYKWFLTSRLGYAMAAVWLVASIANLFSASVARRFGLVRAMVFTHLPNAIFLAMIPLAPNWWWMLILLLASSAFGSMDQAPRSAFVAAVFLPEERTAVMGTINLCKTLAAAGGPLVTGYFHDKKMWHATFVTAGLIKILYDIGLVAMFLNTKLPEHGRKPRGAETIADIDVGILLNDHLADPDEFDVSDDESDHGENRQTKARYEQIEEV